MSDDAAANPTDERELLDRLRAGEDTAFELLTRQLGGRLLATARRILGNEDDARDALQDALLSAFRAIQSFDGGARLSTWLHRIVVNAALMRLRGRQRIRERAIEDLLPRFGDDGHRMDTVGPWREIGVDPLLQRETRELVRQAIDQLPDIYRTVLLLRDIEGLDTEETARQLEVNVAVVKTRLHRARQALRTLLEPRFAEGGP